MKIRLVGDWQLVAPDGECIPTRLDGTVVAVEDTQAMRLIAAGLAARAAVGPSDVKVAPGERG